MVSVDSTAVTVTFSTGAVLAQGQVARGVAENSAVRSTAGPGNIPNVRQSAPVTGAGTTEGPDLVSITPISATQADFRFDEPVQNGHNPDRFFLFDSNANQQDGTAAVTLADANVVRVTFPAGTLNTAVGGSVNGTPAMALSPTPGGPAAVESIGLGTLPARDASAPIVNNNFLAGRTALPDLVRVDVQTTAFGNTVVYTFDQSLAGGFAFNDFGLFDTFGNRFSPTGGLVVSGSTATFTNGFTNSQANAAVLGTVQDSTFALNPPVFPEGCVPITTIQ